MKFYSVWLIVLTMLTATASAANVNFNGGAVGACTLSSNTYSCTNGFSLGSNDTMVIASGYTVVMSNAFAPGFNQGLTMSGSAALQTSGSNGIDLSGSNNISVSGGTITAGGNFKLGSNPQSITANVSAASITTAGSSTSITGTVSASGAINLGSSTTINGAVTAATITTGSSNTITGNVTATGAITTGSSTTINGSVNGASISSGSSTTITGSLVVSGLADLGSAIKVNGSVTANAVQTGSPGNIGGAIVSTTTVSMGSGLVVGGNVSGTTITSTSPVTVNGNVNASTSFTLASGSSVTGNVTAPVVTLSPSNSTVTGNITASTSLDIGSGVTVTGTVKGGSLTMRASNSVINGSTAMTGDVDMGSGTTINGDLSARNVTTHSSNAVINGNAAVNAIYIDWGNSVTKTITCTGAGAVGCSCVTKADPNYQPTCGAPPSSVPHHFQLSHTGTALTCQPQTVTVTACANAACTAPHFTSNVNVTTTPGNQVFTVSGGVNSAATVQSKTPGTFVLGATNPGVSNATVCVNTTTGASNSGSACNMDFSTTGLKITATNHVSMAPGATVKIEALTASSGNQSCVPLVPDNTPVNVDMTCTFSNPVNAANVPVTIGTKNLACGAGVAGAAVTMPLTFTNGVNTQQLSYAEVGQVGLRGSITTSNFQAVGSSSFIAAPKELQITASRAASPAGAVPPIAAKTIGPLTAASVPTAIFAKASEPFTLTVTAVNNNNAATSNFGKESPASKVLLTPTVNDPAWAPVPTGTGSSGQLTHAISAFSGGSSSSSANFDNVGYLQVAASLTGSTYYLDQQFAGFQTKGVQYISRFIPDHFDTELLANADRPVGVTAGATLSCANMPESTNPCGIGGAANSFIHSTQFYFLKVTAFNGANPQMPTTNYAGALSSKIDISAVGARGTDTLPANADASAVTWSGEGPPVPIPAPTRFSFAAGVGTIANPGPSSANLPSFKFTSGYPLADIPPATIYLRAEDADKVSSKRVVAATSVEAPLAVVSGRLLVSNNYGSPKSPLRVKVYAQYYMQNGYVFNPLVNDSSNGSVTSYINYSNCQKALDTSGNNSRTCPAFQLSSPGADLELKEGVGAFTMAKPPIQVNGIGSVDVSLKKTSNGKSIIFYLPSTTGRETFGVYRSGPVIYTREVY